MVNAKGQDIGKPQSPTEDAPGELPEPKMVELAKANWVDNPPKLQPKLVIDPDSRRFVEDGGDDDPRTY